MQRPTTTPPSDNNSGSIANLLANLNAYNTSHLSSCDHLKSSIINLTKARRHKQGALLSADRPYTAIDVREELRASLTLTAEYGNDYVQELGSVGEPDLVDEDDADTERICRRRKVEYQLQRYARKSENADVGTKSNAPGSKPNIMQEGLRQRKKGEGSQVDKDPAGGWAEEETMNEFEREEKMLMESDPIDLFGAFPPPALKEAQRRARRALDGYIAAANAAALILHQVQYLENDDVVGK